MSKPLIINEYERKYLEKKNIKYKHIGKDEFNKHNMLFAEMVAPDRVEDEELHHGLEITDTFVTGSEEGSEQWGDEVWKCVLCKQHFTGYGNNPDPLAQGKGECCDICNTNQVIPARIKMMVA
jgi:hypothetical protein